jgi:Gpi18-like mannosyltransferase
MYKYRNNLKLFIFWGVICLLANVVCTASTPYDGDQSFWVGWVQQLIDGGFGGFKGNYPPLYVFWLWVVAQIHAVLDIAVDKTFFLKFMCLWPVFFSHLFFVDFLCRITEKFNYPDWKKHLLIAFVALNPAILINGPVWGQVDLLPVVLAVLAIYCISRPRYIFLASMLYLLALLAKFQMIAFLPIFGGLFIRNWRTSWKGIPLAVVGAAVVLLPFAIGGNLLPMLSRAYVQTTSQYPYATMNATNLWVLLVGNAAPDNVPIWGVSADGLGFLLKPAILGKILFVIVSVFVLIKSILCKNIRTAFALCTLNGLAFFVLLPGMHERYLLYAVPMAICWLVWDMCRGGVPCLLITLVATLNVNLINPFRGDDVWNTVSMAGCIALVASLLVVAMPKTVNKVLYGIKKVSFPAWIPYVLLSVILLIEGSCIAYRNRPIVAPKGKNIVLLENLSLRQSEQGYGTPKTNRSVDSHMLIVGKQVYKNGLGTHAPSKFVYDLPKNADALFIGAGIDDECYDQGSAIFIIRVDGKEAWRSPLVRGVDSAFFTQVPLQGATLLELETDPDGPNNCDHTNWLNGYIKLR